MYEILAVLATFGLVYSVFAGRIERTWISGPIVFLVVGGLLGPDAAGLIATESDPELLKSLAELTLALVLFTDASSADLRVLRRFEALPVRLLGLGLPLTIAAGFGVGYLLFDTLTGIEIALIATMLAPTDAALGKAVVTNESVPNSMRQGLNVESGLNDGICVPILFLFLAVLHGGADEGMLQIASHLFLEEVGIGLAVGIAVSACAAWMLRVAAPRDWLSPEWRRVTVIAAAFSAFGLAQTLGGSGFIASFAGGLLFGKLVGAHREALTGAAEGIGDAFSLLTWVLFGAVALVPAARVLTWEIAAYAVLSLTVVRMVPVALCLGGLKVDRESRLFMGWFGPRGLASVVFAVIVAGEGLPHGETISAVVACTVLLSILAHGVTANPWAGRYAARAREA